jgi:hypothetical protein
MALRTGTGQIDQLREPLWSASYSYRPMTLTPVIGHRLTQLRGWVAATLQSAVAPSMD